MSKDDRELIEALRNWPAAQDGDALSAGFVSALLASAATRLEALQAQPVGEARETIARVHAQHGGVAPWWWHVAFDDGADETAAYLREQDLQAADAILATLTASPPVVEREAETFNGYSRATAERALARVHAWCAWSENEYAGEDTNPRMCSDDVRTALALVSTPVAQGDEE